MKNTKKSEIILKLIYEQYPDMQERFNSLILFFIIINFSKHSVFNIQYNIQFFLIFNSLMVDVCRQEKVSPEEVFLLPFYHNGLFWRKSGQ